MADNQQAHSTLPADVLAEFMSAAPNMRRDGSTNSLASIGEHGGIWNTSHDDLKALSRQAPNQVLSTASSHVAHATADHTRVQPRICCECTSALLPTAALRWRPACYTRNELC